MSFPNGLFKQEHPGDAVLTTCLKKVAILTNWNIISQQLGRQVMQYASDLPSSCLPWRGVPPRPPYISANTVTPPEIEHKTITDTPKNCNVLRKHYLWAIHNICHEIFTYMRRSFSGSHSHILAPIFLSVDHRAGRTFEKGTKSPGDFHHPTEIYNLLICLICLWWKSLKVLLAFLQRLHYPIMRGMFQE